MRDRQRQRQRDRKTERDRDRDRETEKNRESARVCVDRKGGEGREGDRVVHTPDGHFNMILSSFA